MLDKIYKTLKLLSELIIVCTPLVAATYYTVLKKWRKRSQEMKNIDIEKRGQEFRSFKHLQTIESMNTLQDIVNMFRDKSCAEFVCFCQLENGTLADSQLSNMYMTCLVESNRYSEIPSISDKIQRLPVQKILSLLTTMNSLSSATSVQLPLEVQNDASRIYEDDSPWAFHVVKNSHGYIIGYTIFRYNDSEGMDDKILEETALHAKCSAAIEAELFRFEKMISRKKFELKV